jgi:tRNA(adenine34) deaminase
MKTDEDWMLHAIDLARDAERAGEVPVGAIVVLDNKIIGKGFNCPISANDPTAHAEIIAMRDAAKSIGNYRLTGTTLYVTLEPCLMCAGAMVHARIDRLVYGTDDPKTGVINSQGRVLELEFLNHHIKTTAGVQSQACASLLTAFFRERRNK